MESPVIKIMLIAAGIAAAAAVVTVMWTQLARNTEDIDNTATNAYALASSRTLCEALPEGNWWRKFATGISAGDLFTKDQEDSIWDGDGECGKGTDEPDDVGTVLTSSQFDLEVDDPFVAASAKNGVTLVGGKWINVTDA